MTRYLGLCLSLMLAFWALGQKVDLGAKTAEGYYMMEGEGLSHKLNSFQNFLLINVNLRYEGEISSTDIFIPFDTIKNYYAILPKDRNADIVLYATHEDMARLAAKSLIELGFTEIKVLAGGLTAWQSAGYEVYQAFASNPQHQADPLDNVSRQLGIAPERFVSTGISNHASLGSLSAPLVLVEFSDVNCPYCQAFHRDTFHEIVENYVDSGQLHYVYKHYISVGGQFSQDSAQMGRMCS
ncbi:MAG: thioredoxin domain-containing protein [Deinococcales bacterium]